MLIGLPTLGRHMLPPGLNTLLCRSWLSGQLVIISCSFSTR